MTVLTGRNRYSLVRGSGVGAVQGRETVRQATRTLHCLPPIYTALISILQESHPPLSTFSSLYLLCISFLTLLSLTISNLYCMAANSQCRGLVGIGKRFVNQIRAGTSPDPIHSPFLALRYIFSHLSVYIYTCTCMCTEYVYVWYL